MNINLGTKPTDGAPRPVVRRIVGLLAVILLAGACGGDRDSQDAGSGDDSASQAIGSRDTGSGGDSYGESEGDDAGGDDSGDDGDDGGDAEFDFADSDDAADDMASSATTTLERGLFGDEAAAQEPDPDRLEDNTFEDYGVRPFVDPDDDPLSTFALDVDTGSYVITRRWLEEGALPPSDAVRVEEFVNAFDYDYDPPRSGLEIYVDGGPSPYDEDNVIVRIGIQAEEIADRDRPTAALTFVVDTSGSMDRDDRLGLVKEALEALVHGLDDDDTVAIVTYGDRSDIVLEPTEVRDEDEILDAIDDLRPGGSTNMEAGLETGYELADAAFVEGGINRVILASDGVANVGVVDPDELSARISDRAINGIQLVTIGFGMGNYNDVTMEQLADQGDGFYAYVDDRDEAERLFEDELIATLAPVAIDARIQVEFDDDLVDEYRLIGFENRGVLDSEFRSDEVDAGELSSGHTVTALYELELDRDAGAGDELGVVTLRWQDPTNGDWIEIDQDIDYRDIEDDWSDASVHFRLATTVAVWAEVLRNSPFAADIDLDAIAEEAELLDDDLDNQQTDELVDLTDLSADLR